MKEQQEEFMAMLERCEAALFKVCLIYTDRQPENVRDLYQEIVCALWQAWPRFRGESAEATWVYRVAINTAVTQLRRRRRHVPIVRLTDAMVAQLTERADEGLTERLYKLIDSLGMADRSLIMLYLDGVPSRDVAAITGLSEEAVRKRVERIKQKLVKLNTLNNGNL